MCVCVCVLNKVGDKGQSCRLYMIQTHTHTQGSPVEIQTPAHQNLIGHGLTAPSPLLSLNSTLLSPSSYCAFMPAKKNSERVEIVS